MNLRLKTKGEELIEEEVEELRIANCEQCVYDTEADNVKNKSIECKTVEIFHSNAHF